MAMSRTQIARLGAHASWARTPNRAARTAPAREAFLARFEREVDPDGVLPQAERQQRAEHARKAHMQRLAARSAAARKSSLAGGPGGGKGPASPSTPRPGGALPVPSPGVRPGDDRRVA